MLSHFWKGAFGLLFGLATIPSARAEQLVRVAGGDDGLDGSQPPGERASWKTENVHCFLANKTGARSRPPWREGCFFG
jgi:hypothetical protein